MASGGRKAAKKSSERTYDSRKNSSGTGNGTKKRKSSKSSKSTSTARSVASGTKRRNTKAEEARKNQIKDEIYVLVCLACSVIFILSNFNLAGSVGRSIKWFMFGMIGIIEYIFPVVVVMTIIFLLANKKLISVARIKTIAVYILMILLSGLWQRLYDHPVISESPLADFFTHSADNHNGGGIIGGIVCKALQPLGFWGSLVVMVILLVICLVIITEKSFINGIRNVKDSSKRIAETARQDYDIYREHSARKIELDEQRAQEKQHQYDRKRRARMENKARGVTTDTRLERNSDAAEEINIKDVDVDMNRTDEFSDDIYNPDASYADDVFASQAYEFDATQNNVSDNTGAGNPDIYSNSGDGYADTYDGEYTAQDGEYNYTDGRVAESTDAAAVSNTANTSNDVIGNASDNASGDAIGGNLSGNTAGDAIANASGIPADALDSNSIGKTAGNAGAQQMQDSNNAGAPEHDDRKYIYKVPPLSLLNIDKNKKNGNLARENQATAIRLQQTLQNFGVKVTITDISCGPSVTRYELQPEQGVKVSKIVSLSDDIKLNLAAADIRIEAPIPGKAAIGIEVPNKKPGSVGLRELFETDEFKNHPSPVAFAAGKDIAGKPIIADIAKMPHLLIAGATGSGKSVCINTIIMSIIYRADPDDVKLIMVDPKVVELSVYNPIPHLMIPVVTDPKKASGALNWAVAEMDARYKKFAKMNVRDLKGYNAKISKMVTPDGQEAPEKMPQIVIIIDELADLMMVAPGEVEDAICRLAQLARAAGIHLVIATQRPSVNVITGLIKANVPSRIAFSVSSGVDSRTIIDMNGAEKLLGKGDMLFFPSGYPKPVRVQGAFVSDEEVSRVVEYLKENNVKDDSESMEKMESITSTISSTARAQEDERDSYFADAGRFVIEKEKGSIGMLQRYYKIGFNRAGRIMDQLADAGVVGPELGTKPRKVLMTAEEFEEFLKNNT